MEDRLELLEGLCRGLRNHIQSPHDNSMEDALFLILEELKYLRAETSLYRKALESAYLLPMKTPDDTL